MIDFLLRLHTMHYIFSTLSNRNLHVTRFINQSNPAFIPFLNYVWHGVITQTGRL